ncbi:receptor-like protein 9DC3 [Papaver somniferum]|uniref:receptor-like protein 9DC3 n=1 Tax=Papaver somniferum TaxID=3469 RepID=UPI000E6FE110|nr:receptor-like protein 9DC3 [Papaver somniferum]
MKAFNQITSFLLHFLIFLLISITLSAHGCHEEERRALLNFKSSLDDPSGRLSTWKQGVQHRNCCDWSGIGCSDESLHVVSIDLRNTKLADYKDVLSDTFDDNSVLRGKLSPYLFNITHLEYLDLAFNDFQGSEITHQFSNLTKLIHLDLSGSNFSASSTKWVRGLINLQVLRLNVIDLFEATSSSKENFAQHISYLSNLRDLDISDCSISGPVFPIHEFNNLSHLSTLKMNQNYGLSSSIPLQLANLTSLSVLDLSYCDLQGSIPYLPKLKELDVSDNYDLDIDELTRMLELPWPKLQTLVISGTRLTESIPESISNAPNLVSLSASSCSIQGSLPSSIYTLSRLQDLDLADNNITDSIQSSISNLKYLNFLDLSANNFQGPIPKSICNIFHLQELYLGYNKITGTIPSCITNLLNLSVFEVSKNSITGKFSLFTFINELDLTHLDLSSNKLTVVIDQHHLYPSKFKLESLKLESCNIQGSVPVSICNFTHLNYLDLSFNNLTGTIPPCISKFKKLYLLDLSYNKLSGSIPSSLCSQKHGMPYTSKINLSNNKLSGIIPNSIGNCRDLRYLNLGNNSLTGNVPNELKHTSLECLELNENNLSGAFPMSLILKLLSLIFLNLGNNNFEGIIPTGLGSLGYLTILSLRSNRFNGSIPDDIIHSTSLQILDLSSNHFSGQIPSKLGYLTALTRRFSGFEYFYKVEYLLAIKGTTVKFETYKLLRSGIDLSCNILGGNIPEEIGLLQGLSMLNLSHNHLSSNIPASIGNMSSLESLDLSSNRLSGHIPQSLASIDSLEIVSLSHNNLSCRIPRGNHFDTLNLDGSAFAGNHLLCGFPLKKDCEVDHNISTGSTNPSIKDSEDDREDKIEKLLLYAIVAMGFAAGFWGLFLVLLIKKQKWWFPYWRTINSVAVKIVKGCIHKD